MKIALYDDLHIETHGKIHMDFADADVCVLAGDICVAALLQPHRTDADARKHQKAVREFFTTVSEKYKTILYVMGNHEHWGSAFENTVITLREFLREFDNVTILEKEYTIVDDVVFFGGTLWTDCDKNDPFVKLIVSEYMQDFTRIKHADGSMFTTDDSILEHYKTMEALSGLLSQIKGKKVVVVTHHAPCEESVDYRYLHVGPANFAYFSDLFDYIYDRPQIVAWLHGHIHVDKDYLIGDTRVVCNPRGYPQEVRYNSTGFNSTKVIIV